MQYKSIAFYQGEAADEALACLHRFGVECAIMFILDDLDNEAAMPLEEYLEQAEVREGLGAGLKDDVHYSKLQPGYVLVANPRIGYIGVSREEVDKSTPGGISSGSTETLRPSPIPLAQPTKKGGPR